MTRPKPPRAALPRESVGKPRRRGSRKGAKGAKNAKKENKILYVVIL